MELLGRRGLEPHHAQHLRDVLTRIDAPPDLPDTEAYRTIHDALERANPATRAELREVIDGPGHIWLATVATHLDAFRAQAPGTWLAAVVEPLDRLVAAIGEEDIATAQRGIGDLILLAPPGWDLPGGPAARFQLDALRQLYTAPEVFSHLAFQQRLASPAQPSSAAPNTAAQIAAQSRPDGAHPALTGRLPSTSDRLRPSPRTDSGPHRSR